MDQTGHVVKSLFPCTSLTALSGCKGGTCFPFSLRFMCETLKNVSNLVAKRKIYTCASYGEGCSPEKHQ